jgi:carbon-monoxide dehydrogenase medium subunit
MGFRLETPGTVAEAVRALAEGPPGSVTVLAGGTDLLFDLESGRIAPARIISLRRLPWRSLQRAHGRLTIGSMLTVRALEKDPRIATELAGLSEAIRAFGSVALRNRATVGGNVVRSSASSDLVPVFLTLDARVHLVGPAGQRTLPIAEFLAVPRRPALGPGELVEAVSLVERAPSEYAWQRVRPANDISQVGVAVGRPDPDGNWQLAVGGIAPVPARLPEAERELTDPNPSDGAIERAAEAASRTAPFVTDRRATEAYRRLVVRVLAKRALVAARERGRAARGERR